MDLSTSLPAPMLAFSFAALSSSSVAIPLVLVPSAFIDFRRLVGILDDNCGKITPRRKLSMMEKEGLTDPKESKAVKIGEVLPFREPKSCEKPPIPMLSSLVWEEHGHGAVIERELKGSHVTQLILA